MEGTPPKKSTLPPTMGKLRQGWGEGHRSPIPAPGMLSPGSGLCPQHTDKDLGALPVLGGTWGHRAASPAQAPRETEARGVGSRQGLLQAAAGRAHDLAQGAEGLAQEILRSHRVTVSVPALSPVVPGRAVTTPPAYVFGEVGALGVHIIPGDRAGDTWDGSGDRIVTRTQLGQGQRPAPPWHSLSHRRGWGGDTEGTVGTLTGRSGGSASPRRNSRGQTCAESRGSGCCR